MFLTRKVSKSNKEPWFGVGKSAPGSTGRWLRSYEVMPSWSVPAGLQGKSDGILQKNDLSTSVHYNPAGDTSDHYSPRLWKSYHLRVIWFCPFRLRVSLLDCSSGLTRLLDERYLCSKLALKVQFVKGMVPGTVEVLPIHPFIDTSRVQAKS